MPGAEARHPAEGALEHEALTVAGQLSESARFMRKVAARIGDEPGDRAAVEILLHASRRLTDFETPLKQQSAGMRQAADWIELGRMLEREDAAKAAKETQARRRPRAAGSHLRPVSGAA
jgi:hypothetical protein